MGGATILPKFTRLSMFHSALFRSCCSRYPSQSSVQMIQKGDEGSKSMAFTLSTTEMKDKLFSKMSIQTENLVWEVLSHDCHPMSITCEVGPHASGWSCIEVSTYESCRKKEKKKAQMTYKYVSMLGYSDTKLFT